MTKKYFGTDGIRGAINSKYINGDMFFKFGLASGTFFKSQKKIKTKLSIAHPLSQKFYNAMNSIIIIIFIYSLASNL